MQIFSIWEVFYLKGMYFLFHLKRRIQLNLECLFRFIRDIQRIFVCYQLFFLFLLSSLLTTEIEEGRYCTAKWLSLHFLETHVSIFIIFTQFGNYGHKFCNIKPGFNQVFGLKERSDYIKNFVSQVTVCSIHSNIFIVLILY